MDNKFLQRLKGEKAPKAVVEIQDPTLRQGMSDVPGTTPMVESVPNEMSNTLIVAKGAKCFGVNGSDLTPTTTDEYAGMRQVSGEGAWINASYTFPTSQTRNPVVQIINPNSKWILRLMGDNLLSDNEVIDFTLLVRAGATTVAIKDIAVRRQANQFCKTLEIDFAESVADVVKINGGDTLTVQLLCNDDTAHANIYGGKTVLTLLDRALDGADIQATTMTFEEAAQKIDALERDKADKSYVDATFETKADAQTEYGKIRNEFKSADDDIKNTLESTRADLQQGIDKNAGEIGELEYDKASKTTDFETPITPSNKGATMTEVNDINIQISALRGVGGLLSPYNFGKTFVNPISEDADVQAILTYFIGQIWEGATNIAFNTMDYALTAFNDANGVAHTAAEIFNATAVTNSFDNTRIQLNNTQNTDPKVFEFTNQGILLVGIANQTTAGIVRAGSKSQIIVSASTGDVQLDSSKGPEIRMTIGAMDTRMAELVDSLTDEEKRVVRNKLGIEAVADIKDDVANLKQQVADMLVCGRFLVRTKASTDMRGDWWYDIYSDGLVEMGCYTNAFPVKFPIKLKETTSVSWQVSSFGSGSTTNDIIVPGLRTDTLTTEQVYVYANLLNKSGNALAANDQWKMVWIKGYADPSEYTRDKWGIDTPDATWDSYMTGDPSPMRFKAWTNAAGKTLYTLLAVPTGRGDDMYTEDQLNVYNEWYENQSTAPLPKVADKCGAIGIIGQSRAINGGGVEMGTPGTLDTATAYVRNQALDTNANYKPLYPSNWFTETLPGDSSTKQFKYWASGLGGGMWTENAVPNIGDKVGVAGGGTLSSLWKVEECKIEGGKRWILISGNEDFWYRDETGDE